MLVPQSEDTGVTCEVDDDEVEAADDHYRVPLVPWEKVRDGSSD